MITIGGEEIVPPRCPTCGLSGVADNNLTFTTSGRSGWVRFSCGHEFELSVDGLIPANPPSLKREITVASSIRATDCWLSTGKASEPPAQGEG